MFESAADLFARHGYRDTSVEAIVRRAGVAKGTFFVHFSSKNAIVEELVAQQIAAAIKARTQAQRRQRSAHALARITVLALAKHAAQDRTLSRTVLAASLGDDDVGRAVNVRLEALFDLVLTDLAAAQPAEQRRPRDTLTLRAALMASYYGSVLYWCSSSTNASLVSLVSRSLDSVLGAASQQTLD